MTEAAQAWESLSDAERQAYLDRLSAWRALPRHEQAARLSTPAGIALRDAVNDCPDRGSILPISQQADCGCQGRELTECRAGKGPVAGRVTLQDCFACKSPT
jgi:hypothetical protein